MLFSGSFYVITKKYFELFMKGKDSFMHDTFAERLKQAMKKAHMKQADVIRAANELGIKLGKSHMSQYVSGKTIPREQMIKSLSDILHVEPEWLTGEDSGNLSNDINNDISTKKTNVILTDNTENDPKPEPTNNLKARSNSSISTDTIEQTGNNGNSPERSDNMREFCKSSKLDNVLYDVRGPVLDEANRMTAQGTSILKLNIGNPAPFGFRTPDEVVHDMSAQLTETEGYSDSKGLFAARKAIMQYGQIKNLPNLSIDDIYTGNGVSELIQLSLNALLNDGDEVLVPAPDYPLWTACVNLAGGKAVHYLCDEESEWYPDIDDMRKKITANTKAIVIINPNNPTGALYPVEILQQIVDVAREHQLMIFSDEIYDRLVMDGLKHTSIASLAPDLFCVTFSGLSKSHMVAGYRIGWMVLSGNKRIAKDYIAGLNMLSNMRLCSNVPAQSIVQTALGGYQSVNNYIVPGGRIYDQREFIYNALCDIPGVSVVKPKAAFYIFPKLDKRFNITDDEQFALDLLHDKHILITRGGGFNWPNPDHFRIVYLPRIQVLSESMDKLKDFLSYYRQ